MAKEFLHIQEQVLDSIEQGKSLVIRGSTSPLHIFKVNVPLSSAIYLDGVVSSKTCKLFDLQMDAYTLRTHYAHYAHTSKFYLQFA